jgi:hypothetical protein
MEDESSLPYLQKLIIGLSPKPEKSIQLVNILFFRDRFNITF